MVDELIQQLPEEHTFLVLLERFERLLQKYARILAYEDAYEDLRLFFIELVLSMKNKEIINKTEGEIINYIGVAIKNHYIAISKSRKANREICFSDLSEEQMTIIEDIAAEDNPTDISDYFPHVQILTNFERTVLYMIYVEGYSSAEIAKMNHVSRQYVNKVKLHAIEMIKKNNY